MLYFLFHFDGFPRLPPETIGEIQGRSVSKLELKALILDRLGQNVENIGLKIFEAVSPRPLEPLERARTTWIPGLPLLPRGFEVLGSASRVRHRPLFGAGIGTPVPIQRHPQLAEEALHCLPDPRVPVRQTVQGELGEHLGVGGSHAQELVPRDLHHPSPRGKVPRIFSHRCHLLTCTAGRRTSAV